MQKQGVMDVKDSILPTTNYVHGRGSLGRAGCAAELCPCRQSLVVSWMQPDLLVT
jgi:hypothetical protein